MDGYNEEAEDALTFCEEQLAILASKPSPEGYRRVMERITLIEPQRMTPYQRARMLSCKAEVTYFLGNWERALIIAREASLLANTMPEDAWRMGDIARLQGEIYRRIAEIQRRCADFPGAAESYGKSVGRLWHAAELNGWVSTHSLRDSLARCMGLALACGEDDLARMYIDMAVQTRKRTRLDEQGATEDSVTEWMQALLLQREGNLMQALSAAMRAVDGFVAVGPDNSTVRILWVTLQILFDLVESPESGRSSRASFLTTAQTYHDVLMKHATRGKDIAGLAMGSLAFARLNRLTRPGYRMGVTRIRRVLEKAIREQPRDWATICDGRMSLARELLARAARLEAKRGPQEVEEASAVRREARAELAQAVAEAQAQGSPGFTWWAERELASLP